MQQAKKIVKAIPVIRQIATWAYRNYQLWKWKPQNFTNSADYWETRYRRGGDSGVGSYARFAEFKADVINEFLAKHNVQSIIEFGCGDGNQLTLAAYPTYIGFDVSKSAIQRCRELFVGDDRKTFLHVSFYAGERAEVVLSLDVIYHLVEDDVFEHYLRTVFSASTKFVILYTSNVEIDESVNGSHVRHRAVTRWIERELSDWSLLERIPNRYPYRGDYRTGSFADFFIYAKNAETASQR